MLKIFAIVILFANVCYGTGNLDTYKYKIKLFDVPLDHFSYVNNGTFKIRL